MHVLRSICFALALAISTSAETPVNAKRDLIPTRRAPTLEGRELWNRNIIPKTSVRLDYGLADYHAPSAYVSCDAHEDYPILLLEDIEHLFSHIRCHEMSPDNSEEINLELIFTSHESYKVALQAWSGLQGFLVVTSHRTCNPKDERGAWMVDTVTGMYSRLTIQLTAQSMPLHLVGRSCRIQYLHTVSSSVNAYEALGINARDDSEYTNTFNPGFNETNLPSRLSLWPPTNDPSVDQSIVDQFNELGLQLTCIDCSFQGNFSVGVDIEYDVDLSLSCAASTASCISLNKVNMNLTVTDFQQSADIEISVDHDFSYGLNFTIFPAPIPQLPVTGTQLSIGPAAGISLGFLLDIPVNINFTYGAQALIPAGTFASIDFIDDSGNWNPSWTASGWNQVNVSQIPFHLNSGQFNITASVWLAPFAEIGLTIDDFGAEAWILAHVPMLTLSSTEFTNVTRNCTPVGPNDFEYFGTAFGLAAALAIGPEAHWDINAGDADFILEDLNITTEYDNSFPDYTLEVPLYPADSVDATKCIVLSDNSNIDVAAASAATLEGVPAPTGTMFVAESAVPTWDFPKIESYYSANGGHLPTNVNYKQMLEATTVPSDILQAVKAAAGNGSPRLVAHGLLVLVISMMSGFLVLL